MNVILKIWHSLIQQGYRVYIFPFYLCVRWMLLSFFIDNKQQENEVRFKWAGTGPCVFHVIFFSPFGGGMRHKILCWYY